VQRENNGINNTKTHSIFPHSKDTLPQTLKVLSDFPMDSHAEVVALTLKNRQLCLCVRNQCQIISWHP